MTLATTPTVLCFNPYVRWSLHSARHSTLLHGLHLRGARTLMVLCDGLMSECDLYQPSKGDSHHRTGQSCSRCQAESAFVTAKHRLNYLWLGRWLDPADHDAAMAWAAEVKDPATAMFRDWPIGTWVQSSVHSHYRADALDLNDAEVNATYRRYLASGAIVASAFDRLLIHEQPDTLLLFNGRMAPTRVALELALRRGVKTITEERGFAPGHMRLVQDTHCLDPKPFYDLCADWRDTPLTQKELSSLGTLLDEHLAGQGFEMGLFAAPSTGADHVAQQLSLDQQQKHAVLFTSSTDEPQGQPEAQGAFSHQHEWVRQTVTHFAERPDWTLLIRTHPNSGGKRSVGSNADELAFIDSLTMGLPENVRVILPDDDVSSFDLMKVADCGLIWHSSVGIEMAAIGRRVLRAGNYWFRDADFMSAPKNAEAYPACLENTLSAAGTPQALERIIAAWRFAYCWFFRQSLEFPLVRQPDWARGEPAYETTQDLQPGKDRALDQVCDVILNGSAIHAKAEARPETLASGETAFIRAFIERHGAA